MKYIDYKVHDPSKDPLLPMRVIRLSERASRMMLSLGSPDYASHGMSLVGCSLSLFETLIRRGLITTNTPGHHYRGTHYTLTPLGWAVRKVIEEPVLRRQEQLRKEREEEQKKRDELSSWGTDDRSVTAVREVLFKRVEKEQ